MLASVAARSASVCVVDVAESTNLMHKCSFLTWIDLFSQPYVGHSRRHGTPSEGHA